MTFGIIGLLLSMGLVGKDFLRELAKVGKGI
jgi:hypothetical protein